MKFNVDDKNRCRLVCVKFHLNRFRFAVAVAKCLGGSLLGHSVVDCVTQNTVAECLKRTWTKFTKYLAIYDKVISSRLKKLE